MIPTALAAALFAIGAAGPATGDAAHPPIDTDPACTVQVLETSAGRVRLLYQADLTAALAAGAEFTWSPAVASLVRDLSRGALVGVPLEGDVTVEVVEARRAGTVEAPGGTEQLDELYLAGPAALTDTGYLRRQRVATVRLGPALRSGDPQQGGAIAIYDRIVADVHFAPAPGPTPSSEGSHAEMLYQASVLNYDQARSWRRPRTPTSAAARPARIAADSGTRLRLVVRTQGLYRVTGEDLREAGVDLKALDPSGLRLRYAGGRMLGRSNTVSQGVVPVDVGFALEDGGDGSFDADDYVLFYGEPTERWVYDTRTRRHTFAQNDYTLDNVYWLELAASSEYERAAPRQGAPSGAADLRVDRYRERVHEEDNRHILRQLEGINSGWDWYWDDFQGKARKFSFVIRDALSDPVDVSVRFWGWTNSAHSVDLQWNDTSIGTLSFSGPNAMVASRTADAGAVEGLNQVGIYHLGNELIRLDWIELEYSRRLAALSGELLFSWVDAAVTSSGSVANGTVEFALTGLEGETPRVFDVANGFAEITGARHDAETGAFTFEDTWDGRGTPPRYAVVQSDRWRRPTSLTLAEDAQLRATDRGAEWVAISHGNFMEATQRLAAWRSQDDRFGTPLRSMAVDVQQVYDAFSGGLVDPMAIRSFVKYAVEHWSPAPVYILLVGDASYDCKNGSGTSHANWMPAYQDGISMYDEWYVRLDTDILPDLAIGRLAVQSATQAEGVVDKLIRYDANPEIGPWRGRNLLIADDLTNPQKPTQYETFFLGDAESMARSLLPSDLDLIKHYLAAYPLEGRTKPQARDEFLRLFNEGNLFVTYVGHGNPETLAHEQMFVTSRDLDGIDNGQRWPLMYTAASQVGVFDDPARQSMPELLLNSADGGVIAFISATRLGFHTSNMVLARQWYANMFQSGQLHVPVGLALTAAKQAVQPVVNHDANINIQRYSLLGDPSLRLARPRNHVEIEIQDTLSALEEVTLSGRVVDGEGRWLDYLDGTALVQVYDAAAKSELDLLAYVQLGAPIFRSTATVRDGRFEAVLRVPKDITYQGQGGRVSAYVWGGAGAFGDDNLAYGADEMIVLHGTAEGVVDDETGPEITLGFAGQSAFRSGDFVSSSPVLKTAISDPAGINIAGATGHEIVLRVDGEAYEITEFFSNRDGDYRGGLVEYELPALEPGVHTISLKAWDSFNNSARVEAEVRVAEEGDDALVDLLFHPNPLARDIGHFTYTLTEPAVEARLSVFTLAGTLVERQSAAADLGYNQVEWAAPADLANGTYIYKLDVTLASGAKLARTDRIQVAR